MVEIFASMVQLERSKDFPLRGLSKVTLEFILAPCSYGKRAHVNKPAKECLTKHAHVVSSPTHCAEVIHKTKRTNILQLFLTTSVFL